MIFKYEICNSCETVQHCMAFGCVPIKPTAKTSPEHLLALTQTAGLELDKVIEAFKLAKPPAQHQPLTEAEINDLCPQFEDPMRREMWITGFKAAHNIRN